MYSKQSVSYILPNTITRILQYSFANTTNLTLYLRSEKPPTLASTAFSSTTIHKIYVPNGTLEAYQTATNWSQYSNIMEEWDGITYD